MDKLSRYRANYLWYYVDLISCKCDYVANIYEKYIGRQYEKEIDAFNLKKHKKILHIGSGAYPISIMTLSKNNGSKIVGIDRNKFSVDLAKQTIKKKKIKNIQIFNSNGLEYPINDFDLIIISGCSVPKISVLENIFKNCKKGCKIIIREGLSTINSIYELIDKYPDINILNRLKCSPAPYFDWESFYLEKK
jgi:precorrin-6B methylase 2